jgi:type I restriction enzyme R subunit
MAGRKTTAEGLTREETTFFEHLANLTFGTAVVPPGYLDAMKKLASELVQILQGSIGIVDFWSNPAEQARLRGELADALLMADIPEVTASFNRLAVEILKLAKHRHEQLV